MPGTNAKAILTRTLTATKPEDIVGRQSPAPRRILCFAAKECWPPNTGARMRHYYLSRELARHAQVTYLCFAEEGAGFGQSAIPPLTCLPSPCERLISVPGEPRYTLTKIVAGIFGRTPLPVLNYKVPVMEGHLRRLLNEGDFDLVLIESIQLISYLPIIRAAPNRPPVICDWHNIDSEVMERYSRHAPDVARRFYARLTARRLASLELAAMSLFDAHLAVSERDCQYLKELMPGALTCVIENGVDVDYYSRMEAEGPAAGCSAPPISNPHRVLFVGSMDYHANIDAVMHFASECWPGVYRQRPDLTFTIVGRNPAPEVLTLSKLPGTEITGTIADVRPFYREALAVVVPLRVGGGSRLKILEAFAAGVPVISTSLGAEGLAVEDQKDILIADSAEQISNRLVEVLRNEPLRRKLVASGLDLVRSRYEWKTIGAKLNDFQLSLCRNTDVVNRAAEIRQ